MADRPGRRARRSLLLSGLLIAVAVLAVGATAVGLGARHPSLPVIEAVAAAALVLGAVAGWVPGLRRGSSRILVTCAGIAAVAGAVVLGLLVLVLVLGRLPNVAEAALVGPAVVAAVVAALLAGPLGRRAAGAVRSALLGARRSPDELLAAVAERAGRDVAIDDVLRRLAESMRRDWRLARVELWTRDGTGAELHRGLVVPQPVDTDPDAAAPAPLGRAEQAALQRAGVAGPGWLRVWLPRLLDHRTAGRQLRLAPAVHAGKVLALVVIERAPDADVFTGGDERALAEVARRLAIVLRNRVLDEQLQVTLADLRRTNADLLASRRRLVATADAERRRIERDLHDGAQQHLVALAVGLRLVRDELRSAGNGSGESEPALLDELDRGVREAIATLRDLAHGIYPPLLRDGGLTEALRVAATRGRAQFVTDGVGRYPEQVEAAVYFCCLEALQNAAKHAPGAHVELRLAADEDTLRFTVTDSGPGFVGGGVPGAGLQNMADRVGAVGGSVECRSAPGAGTTVEGNVPVPEESVAVTGVAALGRAEVARVRFGAVGAVHAVARAELRAGWRGLLAMGLLLGLVGGLVLATAAVSERTSTAYPRLVQAVGLDDARILVPTDRPALIAAVPTLPGVAESWFVDGWVAQVDGPEVRYISVGAGAGQPPDLVRPVVVAGRPPAADAADELLVGEPLAENLGLGVGSELTLRLLTPEEIGMFDVGFGEPDGAVVRMRVVGIGRMPAWGNGLSNALASPAFAASYATGGVGTAHVRLVDQTQATRDAFAVGLVAAEAADPTVSVVADYVPPGPSFPTSEPDPAVHTAEQVLVAGLAVFGTVVALGGLLIVGQGLARHHAARREAQWIEQALGLTAVERVAARVLVGVLGAALAGAVGAAVAVAAGMLEPLGSQARFEPVPGFRPSWPIAVAGGIGLAVFFVLLTAAAAGLAGTRGRRRTRPVPRAAWIGRWPALVLGVRMAWSGRGGVPAVATVLGVGLAVAGIVATATFGAGLARLVESPARYGEPGDLMVIDARAPDIAALVADPRVADVDLLHTAPVQLAGDAGAVDALAIEPLKGALEVETVSGRAPTGSGEIAVGPRTAQRLGLVEGARVEVAGPDGPVPLTVTGIVVVRSEERTPLGSAVLVVPGQLAPIALNTPILDANVRAVPGHADTLVTELSSRLEVYPPEVPDEVRNLGDLRLLPELLAAVLAMAAAAGLAHVLLTAGRRHARDVAVLAVLGATPAQVRAAVAVMAVATVLPAVLIGVPLGLAGGRVLWWHVATATGVAGDVALPGLLLAAVAPVALLVALALAAGPALRVTRTPPAAVLAAE